MTLRAFVPVYRNLGFGPLYRSLVGLRGSVAITQLHVYGTVLFPTPFMPNRTFNSGEVRTRDSSSCVISSLPSSDLASIINVSFNSCLMASRLTLRGSSAILLSSLIPLQQSASDLIKSMRYMDSVILGQQLRITVCAALTALRRRSGCEGPKGSARVVDKIGIKSCDIMNQGKERPIGA